jgi:hypothetical protein
LKKIRIRRRRSQKGSTKQAEEIFIGGDYFSQAITATKEFQFFPFNGSKVITDYYDAAHVTGKVTKTKKYIVKYNVGGLTENCLIVPVLAICSEADAPGFVEFDEANTLGADKYSDLKTILSGVFTDNFSYKIFEPQMPKASGDASHFSVKGKVDLTKYAKQVEDLMAKNKIAPPDEDTGFIFGFIHCNHVATAATIAASHFVRWEFNLESSPVQIRA